MAAFDLNHRVYRTMSQIALSPGTAGAWDAVGVSGPGPVIKVGPGDYRMWYEGQGAGTPSVNQTGYATSVDGETWTKYASNPIFTPSGAAENSEASFDSVFFDAGDNGYRAYYHGGNNSGSTFGRAMFYATSPNLTNGGTWTRANGGNPVMQKGGAGAWDEAGIADFKIIRVGAGDYRCWYHGWRVSDGKGQIGYATSTDGITWTKYASNPVLPLALGTWEDSIFCACPLMISPTEFHMWYTAVNAAGNNRMGYATSSDGINWTKSANNPVSGFTSTGGSSDSIHVWQESPTWVRMMHGAFTSTGSVSHKRTANVRPVQTP